MRTFILIALLASLVTVLRAQDTTIVPRGAVPSSRERLPTAQELTHTLLLLTSGKEDPFVALPKIIQWGDSVVGTVAYVLKSQEAVGPTGFVFGASHDNVYAVMILEAIGTKKAFEELFHVAQSSKSIDARGHALNALAITYHEDPYLQRFTPDRELVHLMLNNVDDTTVVPSYLKSIGQIARDGLITWTGKDFGEPHGAESTMASDSTHSRTTLAAFRDTWWHVNSNKVIWNNKSKLYKIP